MNLPGGREIVRRPVPIWRVNTMKIVGFEANEGLRLGVVEGDNVIDLQAVDAKAAGQSGRRAGADNGDLKPLARPRQARAGERPQAAQGPQVRRCRWRGRRRSSASA